MSRYSVRRGSVTVVVDDGLADAFGRILGPEWSTMADLLDLEGSLLLEAQREQFPRDTGDAARGIQGDLVTEDSSGELLRYRFSGEEPYTYVITGKRYGHAWSVFYAEPVEREAPLIGQRLAEGVVALFEGDTVA